MLRQSTPERRQIRIQRIDGIEKQAGATREVALDLVGVGQQIQGGLPRGNSRLHGGSFLLLIADGVQGLFLPRFDLAAALTRLLHAVLKRFEGLFQRFRPLLEILGYGAELLFLGGQPFALDERGALLRLDLHELVMQAGGLGIHAERFIAKLLHAAAGIVDLPPMAIIGGRALVQFQLRLEALFLHRAELLLELGKHGGAVAQLAVEFIQFAGVALRQAAVFHDALGVDPDQVLGAVEFALGVNPGLHDTGDFPFHVQNGLAQLDVLLLRRLDLLVGHRDARGQVGDQRFAFPPGLFKIREAVLRGIEVQHAHFLAEGLVAMGFAGLSLERADLALDLADDVGQPQQIRVRMLELAQGLALVALVLGDTAGFLENLPAVLRTGAEDLVDAPLRHE